MAKAKTTAGKTPAKRTRIASKSKAANNNFAPSARDTLAAQYISGMLDSRYSEIRRKPDIMKVVERGYMVADCQIEYALGMDGD